MTIEDSLIEIAKELDTLTEYKEESEEYLKKVEIRLRKSIQSVEARRFNPFKGTGAGGNQSFAVSFLNENGEGLILSSLYSSDRMSVFAKPVHKFVSPFELTDEENAALEKSKDVVAAER
jgi:aspartate aminotransferase-like enzyme